MLLVVASVAVVALLITNTVFLTETLLGARLPQLNSSLSLVSPETVVVLVPAHNEAAKLASVLSAQLERIPRGMRLLVVADNCTDRTADIARARGAEVVERDDPSRRGKGFALAFGRAILEVSPPECVIVIDADTVPTSGSLERLAVKALDSGRPVQGAYILEPRIDDPHVARFSAASFYIKNVVRQIGGHRIGAPAILTGSGMAFPWSVFANLPLETGHIAEDLMLGVHSALEGAAPLFDPHAWIIGSASSTNGTAVQRRRWESGFVQVGCDHVMPLWARALRRRDPALAWLALHLSTPPLILLLAGDAIATVVAGGLWMAGASAIAFTVISCSMMAMIVAVPFSLAMQGRLDLLRGWPAVPRYVFWKLCLSVRSVFSRERSWVRTDRE